ncbi:MAG: hypothetical protein R3B41_01350 [Candidatus Doudnabacteria bacterium]
MEEKLAKLQAEQAEADKQQVEQERVEELVPIRETIKQLEKQRYDLEIILGSLNLETDKDVVYTMKDLPDQVEKNLSDASEKLQGLFDKYEDQLKSLGIQNVEGMVESGKLDEYTEIDLYKKAAEQAEHLNFDNELFQRKLKNLGITVAAGKDSYEQVEHLLAERITELDTELIKNKLLTPEGRVDLTNELAEKIKTQLPKTKILSPYRGYQPVGVEVEDSGYGTHPGKIDFNERRTEYRGWEDNELVPDHLSNLKDVYDEAVFADAVKKVYSDNLDSEFSKFDREHANSEGWLKKLEENDSRSRNLARDSYRNFIDNTDSFKEQAEQEIDRLAGIDKDTMAKFKSDYYMVTGSLAELTEHKDTASKIDTSLRPDNQDEFPPQWDWNKLNQAIQVRTETNEQFIEAVKGLQTKEDLERFFDYENKDQSIDTLSSFSTRAFEEKKFPSSSWDKKYSLVFRPPEMDEQTYKIFQSKYKHSLKEFIGDMEAVQKDLLAKKEQANQLLENAVDAHMVKSKLIAEMDKYSIGREPSDVDRYEQSLVSNKEQANDVLSQLSKIEVSYPDQQIEITDRRVRILDIQSRWEKGLGMAADLRDEIKQLDQQIQTHKSNKPRLIGKSKWESELQDLEDQKNRKQRDLDLQSTANRELDQAREILIKIGDYGKVNELFQNLREQGTPKEAFDHIKQRLDEIKEERVPQSVKDLQREFNHLKQEMS